MGFVFRSVEEAIRSVGAKLGESEWLAIDQARIDLFAKATGDFQWIHVDPVRAELGPFGRTVAHGYLTLSLINKFLPEVFRAEGMKMGLNYGLDRVRFPAPVPVGSRVRASGEFMKADPIEPNAVQTTVRIVVEVERSAKPGCVADVIGRYYF